VSADESMSTGQVRRLVTWVFNGADRGVLIAGIGLVSMNETSDAVDLASRSGHRRQSECTGPLENLRRHP